MTNTVTVIDIRMLTSLSETAQSLPRLRKNYNVHKQLDDPVQRLYNAMEPNTYVRPHRHQGDDRWEFFQVVSGSAAVLTFDPEGTVLQKIVLTQGGPNVAIEIPGNSWHTIVSLQTGTVLFEIKKGPYQAVTDKDFAVWAPVEGEDAAKNFVQWFVNAEPGQICPFR
ncbi:WbuC family cupin fold metalloprotein [Kaarinaea lacus]